MGDTGRVTIHSEHPFLPPPSQRNQVRRFRGRLAAPVTAWTANRPGGRPAGLTVSSMLIADGDPGELIGLIDPESDLFAAVVDGGAVAISVLRGRHRQLADALAGLAPAPGGPFRTGGWTDTGWGPVPDGAACWLGARLHTEPVPAGWAMLVRARIETLTVADGESDPAGDVLAYLHGRYREIELPASE